MITVMWSCLLSPRAAVSEADLKICSSLDIFINNTNLVMAQCERDSNCTVVTCTMSDTRISQIILNSQTKFLPCLSPPAISLLFLRPNGSVFSSHLINETMEVPLLSTAITVDSFDTTLHLSLHVNISHTSPDYLPVEVRMCGVGSVISSDNVCVCVCLCVCVFVCVCVCDFN